MAGTPTVDVLSKGIYCVEVKSPNNPAQGASVASMIPGFEESGTISEPAPTIICAEVFSPIVMLEKGTDVPEPPPLLFELELELEEEAPEVTLFCPEEFAPAEGPTAPEVTPDNCPAPPLRERAPVLASLIAP